MRQTERDQDLRAGFSSSERECQEALERENREHERANKVLRKASACFA